MQAIALAFLICAALPAAAQTNYGSELSDWKIADNSPNGASVTAVNDSQLNKLVINTQSAGTQNSFLLGGYNSNNGWNNQTEFWLNWSMRTAENYVVFVRVQTLFGARFLYYTHANRDYFLNASGQAIHHGLGPASKNGEWENWSRNLAADLKDAEPTNQLIAVNGIVLRGNISISDISLTTPTPYSDAENGSNDGWRVSDRTPSGATIENIPDPIDENNRVIRLSGTDVQNSFINGSANATRGWGNSTQQNISWRTKASENFRFFVRVSTTNGSRLLWYDARSKNLLANASGKSIHHGLGSRAIDGQWHSFSRNLQSDLADVEPQNEIISIDALVLRGNVLIDDVNLGIVVPTPTTPLPIPTMPRIEEYEMVFNDEFNDTSLDATKWNTGMLWGPYQSINSEQQLYVDTLGINQDANHSPFEFTGESLIISATPVTGSVQPPTRPAENDSIWSQFPEYRYNGPTGNGPGYQPTDVVYLSGVITSYESFKMTHGYVETRVKMPAGQGLWPAFWLLNSHYIEDSPEIDVVEFLGHQPNTVYHTYHYFDIENGWQKISTPSYETNGPDWTADFHTFGLEWSPREIAWFVDGVEVKRITDADYAISTQAMYLIANLAVGGTWPGNADDTTPFPAEFEIDYIRAYKKKLSDTLDLAGEYQMMFNDEFDGSTLDTTKWNTSFLWGPYLTINNEEQYYVDIGDSDSDSAYSPFTVDNGILTITADHSYNSPADMPPPSLPNDDASIWQENPQFRKGPYDGAPDYTSGIITSYDAFKFVNGYAEIRASVPSGDGLWPAFWLLNAYYVGPMPEIDIMEIIGENTNTAYHTFHRFNDVGESIQTQYTSEENAGAGFANGFHTYGVRWRPGKITWYVNGEVVGSYVEPEGDKNDAYQLMYVIANLAVGGNFNTQEVDTAVFPAQFAIDYIRVYQEK